MDRLSFTRVLIIILALLAIGHIPLASRSWSNGDGWVAAVQILLGLTEAPLAIILWYRGRQSTANPAVA